MPQVMPLNYIGDGVYIECTDGFQYRMFTSDGIRTTNEIFLDPYVVNALRRIFSEQDQAARIASSKDEDADENE